MRAKVRIIEEDGTSPRPNLSLATWDQSFASKAQSLSLILHSHDRMGYPGRRVRSSSEGISMTQDKIIMLGLAKAILVGKQPHLPVEQMLRALAQTVVVLLEPLAPEDVE